MKMNQARVCFATLLLLALMLVPEGNAQPSVDDTQAGQSISEIERSGDRDGSGESVGRELPDDSLASTPEGAAGIPDAEAPAAFLRASEAYGAGDYPAAQDGFRSLVEAGFGTAEVHYNLANSLLRSGELGLAIAEYRRALSLRPRDQDVRANLTFARESTKDAVAPPAPAAWAQTLLFWHYSLSTAETVKILVLLSGLFWLAVASQLLLPSLRLRPLALVVLVLVLVFASSLFARWRSPQSIAVVLPAQTDVYSGTDLQSRVIFNLHAGTELAVTSTDERWTQFRMPDGQRGWLPTEHVELVAP